MRIDEDLDHVDVVGDPAVAALLRRLYREEAERYDADPEHLARWDDECEDVFAWSRYAFPVRAEQGAALYLLARATRATTVVEFATSLGFSTVFLAAALRDNGGGTVVTAELVPEKAAAAEANLATVGLDRFVKFLVGDARETLVDLAPSTVDLLVIDGWPTGAPPSIDRQVLDLVTPALRPGALVFDDNGEDDVLERLAGPGFRRLHGEIGGGTVAIYDTA